VCKRSRTEALRRERDGLVSHILLHAGDVPETQLTVTWVDVDPGSAQRSHSHAAEQVYVVVRGWGRMKVGDEERVAASEDLIRIPPDAPHGIENPLGRGPHLRLGGHPHHRLGSVLRREPPDLERGRAHR
jgi:mannose-6-phosphate isomerase-like protein (cupin superfamily)